MHLKALVERDAPASWLQPTLPCNAASTCLPMSPQSALDPARPHSRPWGFRSLCSTGMARMCFLLPIFVVFHHISLGYSNLGLSLGLLFLTLVVVTLLIALNVLSPSVHILFSGSCAEFLCFLFPACDKLRVVPFPLHSSVVVFRLYAAAPCFGPCCLPLQIPMSIEDRSTAVPRSSLRLNQSPFINSQFLVLP
jgi:hypothetical protein